MSSRSLTCPTVNLLIINKTDLIIWLQLADWQFIMEDQEWYCSFPGMKTPVSLNYDEVWDQTNQNTMKKNIKKHNKM